MKYAPFNLFELTDPHMFHLDGVECLTLEHEGIEICPFFEIPTHKNALYLANVDLLLRLAGLGGCGGWRMRSMFSIDQREMEV